MQRRGFLGGLGAMLAAPSIITRPGLLMPVRTARLLPRTITATPMFFGADFAADKDRTLLWVATINHNDPTKPFITITNAGQGYPQ